MAYRPASSKLRPDADYPIYAEAAYFSMYIYTSPQTRTLYDIAIFYMYPPYDDSINTYQGQLAALLPDMLTPAAS